MFFDDYQNHSNSKLNPELFWEYNYNAFDFEQMRPTVVQRVIERGWKEDWYAMLNLYGMDAVKDTIRKLSYLNDKDLNFASILFGIPLSEMKCYTRKQSMQQHWNS